VEAYIGSYKILGRFSFGFWFLVPSSLEKNVSVIIGSLKDLIVFSTICFSGLMISLKSLQCDILLHFISLQSIFFRIKSLVFAISLAIFFLLLFKSTYQDQLIISRYCKVSKFFFVSPIGDKRTVLVNH